MAGRSMVPTSVEVLTRALSFAEQRHHIIANNIANANTLGYKAQRAPVGEFQRSLLSAIEESAGRRQGPFRLQATRHISDGPGGLQVSPLRDLAGASGILRHDENNVSLEKEMGALAENTMMYRTLSDLLRKQYMMLRMAAAERVS